MEGSFIFTSPTIYLAHREITRIEGRELHSRVVAGYRVIRTPGIFPLSVSDISSVRPKGLSGDANHNSYEQAMAKGSYDGVFSGAYNEEDFETVPFDFGNLIEPVPASVYYDARHYDCIGKQNHCGTITEDSYRPNLRIASSIWVQIFSNFVCQDPLVVDPPIAISPIEPKMLMDQGDRGTGVALAEPTLPALPEAADGAFHEPPRPGQSPGKPHPSPTAVAIGPLQEPWSNDGPAFDKNKPKRPGENNPSNSDKQDASVAWFEWLGVPGPRFWWDGRTRWDSNVQEESEDGFSANAKSCKAQNKNRSGCSNSMMNNSVRSRNWMRFQGLYFGLFWLIIYPI
jgi:hypothetical protein